MTPELPDDIDALKQMLQQLQQQVGALESENQSLQSKTQSQAKQIDKLEAELERVLEQLKLSQSRQYGKRSEKTPRGVFNEAEQHQARSEPQHHKKGRNPLPENLPREEVVHTLDEPRCECGGEMHACGYEESEQLKIIPAKLSVIKHRRTKYACRACEQQSTGSKIITAPMPAQPIPRSIASPETLAAIVTSKYCDALPLYRQTDILARVGLDISRATLANWCIRAGQLLEPLLAQMHKHLLSQRVICADETRVQVLKETGKKAESTSWMWVYRSGEHLKRPVVLFDYQPGRGQAYPKAYLEGFDGYLQTDGYSAYDTVEKVTQAGCWAHARRKFHDAEKVQPKKKTGRATQALKTIKQLYNIEAQLRALPPDQRQHQRQQKAKPVLDKFHQWLSENASKVVPKSQLGVAVTYALNQWGKLIRYLDDGELSIDNNVTERDIRPFAIGRNNWMFANSVNGAEASAALYSIVMTCRANDINPYYYFQRVFAELPQRADGADLTDLMPWAVDLSA